MRLNAQVSFLPAARRTVMGRFNICDWFQTLKP
jgi:hypothetical protein